MNALISSVFNTLFIIYNDYIYKIFTANMDEGRFANINVTLGDQGPGL
jgi:hypothetical protein